MIENFAIKMKTKSSNPKSIFEKIILKNLISKSKNEKIKFKKKFQILKSLIKNLYKIFSKMINYI